MPSGHEPYDEHGPGGRQRHRYPHGDTHRIDEALPSRFGYREAYGFGQLCCYLNGCTTELAAAAAASGGSWATASLTLDV